MTEPEREFYVLNSLPIRHVRKRDKELDESIRTFEKDHGTELTELCLVLVHGLRHLKMEDRLIVGLAIARETLSLTVAKTRTRDAKHKAARRHMENYAMKADVEAWLNENYGTEAKSMEEAARKMAGSLVPVAHRTVRGWVKEWRDKQSAGRP